MTAATPESEVDQVFALMEGVAVSPERARAVAEEIHSLPCWEGEITLAPLPGGLSNINFMVTCGQRGFVVRYGADVPDLGIRRSNEAAALRAAHAVGTAPAVVYSADRMIVMEALEGKALSPADIADPDLIVQVAAQLQVLHREAGRVLDSGDFVFWPYHHGRWYARQIAARPERLAARYVSAAAQLGAAVGDLEARIGPRPIVFGHGDLVPGNVFRCADGAIRFIDLEYAGFGPDLFDLAGLGMNAELDEQATLRMLRAYFGAEPDARLLAAYRAMVLVASIRETLWCIKKMLDDQPIAFDYSIYADMCLNRHQRLLQEGQTH